MPDYTTDSLPDPLPSISVIIPARNEERFIGACLEAVLAQDYPRALMEIIVVDNGSTDNTAAIARKMGARVCNLPAIQVGALRNRGAQIATGDILAFLDADCLPPPRWLKGAAEALRAAACVTGDSYDIPTTPHWIERAWFAQEPSGRRQATLIPAGDMILPRAAFLALGGFDEALVAGEDAEFCLRARKVLPIIADDRTRVVHLGNPKSLRKFMARETWHGMGALGSLELDWKDKPLLGTVVFAMASMAQVAGLFLLAAGHGGRILLYSTSVIALLLTATLAYRLRAIRDMGAIPALIALYYVYYLARSRSLVMLAFGRSFERGQK